MIFDIGIVPGGHQHCGERCRVFARVERKHFEPPRTHGAPGRLASSRSIGISTSPHTLSAYRADLARASEDLGGDIANATAAALSGLCARR